MKEELTSVIVGAVFGGGIGLLKHFLLWRPLFKKERQSSADGAHIAWRYLVSMLVNILTLVAIYIFHHKLPFDYVWLLVGAAIALSLCGRLHSVKKFTDS